MTISGSFRKVGETDLATYRLMLKGAADLSEFQLYKRVLELSIGVVFREYETSLG